MILPLLLLGFATAAKSAEYLDVLRDVEGCVNQGKFVKCYNGNSKGREDNFHMCSYLGKDINCFATYCWNKVYTCQYQQLAINYGNMCGFPNSPVPYFPTPLNATNSCSCNFGWVARTLDGVRVTGDMCQDAVQRNETTTGEDKIHQTNHCKCCQISESYSILAAICPNTNPFFIGHNYIQEKAREFRFDSLNCDEIISSGRCAENLGFPLSIEGVSKPLTYLHGAAMSSFTRNNTGEVTNNPGTLLVPPTSAGNVITWTGYQYTTERALLVAGMYYYTEVVESTPRYTITAASATLVAVEPEVTKVMDSTPDPTTTANYSLYMGPLPRGGGLLSKEMNPILLFVSFVYLIMVLVF